MQSVCIWTIPAPFGSAVRHIGSEMKQMYFSTSLTVNCSTLSLGSKGNHKHRIETRYRKLSYTRAQEANEYTGLFRSSLEANRPIIYRLGGGGAAEGPAGDLRPSTFDLLLRNVAIGPPAGPLRRKEAPRVRGNVGCQAGGVNPRRPSCAVPVTRVF